MNIKNTIADTVMEYICRLLLVGNTDLSYRAVECNTRSDPYPLQCGRRDRRLGRGKEWCGCL